MGFKINEAPKKPSAGKAKKPAAKKPASAKKPAAAKKPEAANKPAAAKKPEAAKKPTAAKKPAAATKPAVAKKPTAEKPEAKAPEAPAKAEVKRVPPQVARKVVAVAKPQDVASQEADAAKAVALAMSIAEEMKRSAALAEHDRVESEIKLSRRPTSRVQGKDTVKFPPADLKEFRRRLLEARAEALSGADAIKATGFNESEDHEADGGDGTNQTLRLQALGQMGNINRTIQQIEEAMHRIDDGTYGVCTVCGQLIRKPRLLNQPFVLTCMECQSEMERTRT
jgi:lysophospholipase